MVKLLIKKEREGFVKSEKGGSEKRWRSSGREEESDCQVKGGKVGQPLLRLGLVNWCAENGDNG